MEAVLLNELMESLTQSAGGAWQLAHSRHDPRWLVIRDILEMVRSQVADIAVLHTAFTAG